MNADEMTPSVHGESVAPPEPATTTGSGTNRPTVLDLFAAIHDIARYAMNEPGSQMVQQAELVQLMLPKLMNAVDAAIVYRTCGHHRPSIYPEWVAVTVEVPASTEQLMDRFLESFRR